MTIVFEPNWNIGDIVALRIKPETKYVVEGYSLKQININGEVTFWRYMLYNSEGAEFFYSEQDVLLIERVQNNI